MTDHIAGRRHKGATGMLSLRKKILVAIDGSPLSDKAAEEAVRMAAGNPSQFKSKIYAMLVLPNAPRTTFTDFVPPKPITETEQWQELREKIFYVVEKNATEAQVPLEIKVAYGDPADELIGFAEREEIDVIVIGSTGKGFLKRKVLGSVSDKVVRHARCSVYVVRG
jgi:nucleotide-binding universal stress UspA family protein